MNINDFEKPECPSSWSLALKQIFERQVQLMAKYKDIEKLPDAPVSLHTANGQRIIRDFAWRVTEELSESYEAIIKHEDEVTRWSHAREEFGDAFHFMIELLIFAGITDEQCITRRLYLTPMFIGGVKNVDHHYWIFTYKLGVACNFLRNKAWKTSHVPTDEARFREAMLEAFNELLNLWLAITTPTGKSSAPMEELHAYYFRKSEVNRFRQRSAY